MKTTRRALSVYQVNQYIKSLMESDIILSELCVEAEISNFKPHYSGHLYFTIKDELAAISCVMFRSQASRLSFMPENGMRVVLFGHASMYEKTGSCQIYAEYMEPAGVGAMYIAFERLKAKLASEGLFDTRHKKPIPEFPQNVAVITSPTGAVVRDIIQISKRRNPAVGLVIMPVSVQGHTAADEVADAIFDINKWGGADVIIVARGGGSLEDLWAFNQEKVARAAFNSKIPVISAIGHETDFTILDFSSDLRAPTPSAAAELAIPALDMQVSQLLGLKRRLIESMRGHISMARAQLKATSKASLAARLLESVNNRQIYNEQLFDRLNNGWRHSMEIARVNLRNTNKRLESASPYSVLNRGYSILYMDGKVIPSANTLSDLHKRGRCEIQIKMRDGDVEAEVISVKTDETAKMDKYRKKLDTGD